MHSLKYSYSYFGGHKIWVFYRYRSEPHLPGTYRELEIVHSDCTSLQLGCDQLSRAVRVKRDGTRRPGKLVYN